jgi:RNA polymerase sigma-70 factor (ECF subfamily)
MPPADESPMFERSVSSQSAAFAVLYDRYSTLVFSVATRILRSRHEAEDVVQQVFLQLWHCWTRFDSKQGSVAGWLTVITRNKSIDRLRMDPADQERPSTEGALSLVADGSQMLEAPSQI